MKTLLQHHQKFVVYGLSPDSHKASHYGTYPKPHTEGKFKIYSQLRDVPAEYCKMVDVFRTSDRIPEVVDEVIALGGVEVLWLQLGIEHPEAEKRAEAAGIRVVSNRCLIIEHEKFFG